MLGLGLSIVGKMILKAVALRALKKATKVVVKAVESEDVTLKDAVTEELIKTIKDMPNEITDIVTHVEIQRRLDEEVK